MRAYDEAAAQFGTAQGPFQCQGATHVYESDTPTDYDVCACGKFYFVGAQDDQTRKAQQG